MTNAVSIPDNYKLPPLREELRILPGVPALSGAPSWIIFDPLRHRFFQIDRDALFMLRHWKFSTAGSLRKHIETDNLDLICVDNLGRLIEFLYTNGLTQSPPQDTIDSYVKQADATRIKWWRWLVHHYLFIRIPLVRPHRFLAKTAWIVEPFFSRVWLIFVMVITVLGIYLASRQWDSFVSTFLYFFSLQGAVLYIVTLIVLKIIHELGHAYTATRFGCRIPTMGVAILVLFPVLYTDTTDAWRLTSRRKRLLINSAGVITELMIAGIATLLWVFLPEGPWRSAAFIVATTSWIMTLLVNLSPFMRFDGYYFLSDLLGVQNLQERAFALTRWSLREKLFGIGLPPPELFGPRLRKGLIIYAWSTWIYRLLLFLTIALMVYVLFFKALGIVLFVIEIIWFIGLPVIREVKEWWLMRKRIVSSPRAHIVAGLGVCLLIMMVIPWSTSVKAPALLSSSDQARIFSPESAKIVDILVEHGERVNEGQMLFQLMSPELDQQLKLTQERIDLLAVQLNRRAADKTDLASSTYLGREMQVQQNRLLGLKRQYADLAIKSPISGQVTTISSSLHEGRWISDTELLARITGQSRHDIVGYVAEDEVWRLSEKTIGVFTPDNPERSSLVVELITIASTASEVIDVPYLVSHYGGGVAVRLDPETEMEPVTSQFKIISAVSGENVPTDQTVRGVLTLEGSPDSFLSRVYRQIVKVLIRESGF